MKIKKIYQGTIPTNKILNEKTESNTDTYSCDYINNIIESGNNENGSWVKFSDGTMIVRHTFTQGKIAFTTAIVDGKLYQGENAIECPNYPVEFIEAPQVSLQPKNNMWGVILFPDNTSVANNKTAGTYRMIRVGTLNNGFNVTFDLIAVGKWK